MNLDRAIDEVIGGDPLDTAIDEVIEQKPASTEPFEWDFNWGKMLKNFPGSVGRIWADTAKAALTKEGRAALGQLTKEVGQMATAGAASNPALARDMTVLPQLFQFYAENYNIFTGEGREKFQKYVEENPAEVLADAISVASMGAGAAAKLSLLPRLNASRHLITAGKIVETAVDPTAAVQFLPTGRANPSYNPEMSATYGRTDTGAPMASERGVADVAEDILGPGQGTSQGDVPAMILTDSGDVQMREGLQMHTPGEVEQTARGRFDTSKEGIAEYQRQMVNVEGTTPGYDPFDTIEAGDQVVSNFRSEQLGENARIRGLYDELETMGFMDTQVPERTMQVPVYNQFGDLVGDDIVPAGWMEYFEETMRTMLELKRTDSKLLPNADYQKSIEILKQAIETAEADGFSVRDFDRLRTNYRQRMDLALRNGEVTATGSGTVATKMYAALTNDFYDLLDKVVPDPAFKQKIQEAKREYADLIAREDTRVGKFLLKNQANPRRIIDSILKGDLIRNATDMADLAILIGKQGMRDLQPALVSRLFDTALRQGNWSPTGLRSAIAGVNSANKNKLRVLFGDKIAKNLTELAEFSARFAREARVKTNSPTGFLNRIAGTSSWQSISVRLAEIGSIAYYGGMDVPRSAAMAGAFGLVNYFGSKGVEAWMNSVNGRRMMLEGGLQFGDTVITEDMIRFALGKTKTAGKVVQRGQRVKSSSMKELERRFGSTRTGVYQYAQ